MADAEAIGRLISLSLRVPSLYPTKAVAEGVVKQLSGIGGTETVGFGHNRVRSLADGVARVMGDYLSSREELNDSQGRAVAAQQELPLPIRKGDLCPECGQPTLVLEEGCQKCYSCGASKC